MSLWRLLDDGKNLPSARTRREQLLFRIGRWLVCRHPQVSLAPSVLIHPSAMVHPRQARLTIGESSTVASGAVVQGAVRIGSHSTVQSYAVIVGYGEGEAPAGQVTIGDDVRIAPQVMIIAANHVFDDPDQPIRSQGLAPAPIVIESDVWLGGRVVVTAGVTVGRGSVIGAGAVVTRDIPPFSIAVGVPAKVIGQRGELSGAPEDDRAG